MEIKIVTTILLLIIILIYLIYLIKEKNRIYYKYYEILHYKEIIDSREFEIIKDYYPKSKNDVVNSINWLCSYYESKTDLSLWAYTLESVYSRDKEVSLLISKSSSVLNYKLIKDFVNDIDINNYLFSAKTK
jgi:hypothetical protein